MHDVSHTVYVSLTQAGVYSPGYNHIRNEPCIMAADSTNITQTNKIDAIMETR
jgi:hypothetical protein